MSSKPTTPPAAKAPLHPRNKHQGSYDFPVLTQGSPALAAFVSRNKYGTDTIDFSSPAAVKALNQALLKHFYGIGTWDIPAGYLCPPIPGRADYVHYLADLLAASNGGTIPKGPGLTGLDVGVGANCIYPILGHQEYGWNFVGSDTDAKAVQLARQLVVANDSLRGHIDLRVQDEAESMLKGIMRPGEVFDFVMCNPPFHTSAAEAAGQNQRKRHGLGHHNSRQPALNFGGQPGELWYPGGEERFVRQLVKESATRPTVAFWYTALISKQTTVPGIHKELSWTAATEVQTIDMTQGQKSSRFVAWTFLTPEQQATWRTARWTKAEGK
jgi:23S rRNA (adenine1618-N6)-methyltransferase